jgi:hypothetical protein
MVFGDLVYNIAKSSACPTHRAVPHAGDASFGAVVPAKENRSVTILIYMRDLTLSDNDAPKGRGEGRIERELRDILSIYN